MADTAATLVRIAARCDNGRSTSMELHPGTRIGPYEIGARLGAGGMGEVFRAQDTRLGRGVAIKVLPADFAANARLKLRFEREARAISHLNHPHICTLYDVGDGYLVMELLEGETLADRAARGPLPLADVLRFGAEIADALDTAHREGVVHRDLKPGNVMLTSAGVKLLDFGLAKSAPDDGGFDGPTQQKSLTEEGTVVGTFQYMAPEQVEGGAVDARTDIFALGAVLYEMATGHRAFDGKSRTSLIAAILKDEPRPIAELQPLTPPALEHVVARCLRKNPEERWQSVRDVAEELRWIRESDPRATAKAAPERTRAATLVAWTVAVAAVLGLLAGAFAWKRHDAAAHAPMRFSIPLVASPRIISRYGLLAVAPDGKSIVYSASGEGTTRLYRRNVGVPVSTPIEGSVEGFQPFFSPDGKWIGFFTNRRLMKVPVGGGSPITIHAASPAGRGADWGDDGSIVFAPFLYGGVNRISANGGEAQALTTPDRGRGERNHRWPHMLPGSKAFLFTIGYGGSWNDAKIAVQRIDTGARTIVVHGGFDGRFLPPDRLLFMRGVSLYAVQFDLDRLEVRSNPVRLLENVSANGAGSGEWAFSRDGSLLTYLSAGATRDEGGVLKLLDRAGKTLPTPLVLQNRDLSEPRWSPDGTRIAAGVNPYEVWVFDPERGTSTRLASGTRSMRPAWSADGKRVTYASESSGPWVPFWRAADGSDEQRPVLEGSSQALLPLDWSRDGRELLATAIRAETGYDICIYDAVSRTLRPVTASPNTERDAAWSPDGQWIAYVSDESGRNEVYVRSREGSSRWAISSNGGEIPAWRSPNEIVYRAGAKLMRVAVRTDPGFAAEAPQVLFEGQYDSFDVTPDGQRFLVVERRSGTQASSLEVIVNWRRDVERRVRAGSGDS